MKEIRLHGRGGQGVLIAAELIAGAAIEEGKYASSFPLFTAERRGAPVMAFGRIDGRPIRERTQVYNPDCVILVDPRLRASPEVCDGLRADGIVLMNSTDAEGEKPHPNVRILGRVGATRIALEELGIPAFNTTMIGAFAAVTGWIDIKTVLAVMGTYFKGQSLAKNRRCVERGYEEVRTQSWDGSGGAGEAGPRSRRKPAPVTFESPWTETGRLRDIKVGDWRYFRPTRDEEKCCHCGWCFLLCPTGCIAQGEKGYAANLDYCKGCGICAEECPVHAIAMVPEST
jgi:2-oxoacid:acceptor oxidoreductase gamma subunit (pyruvate/2-ketoisovalerate family)/2-oxoacid:acceptor oxidoreductase delta subunit (pyruvate/2-ketoisovalerate family)